MGQGTHRLAVLRALQLGDMLCAVPALRSLRAAYPESQITLIGLPWAREFASRYSDLIDEVVEFPGWPAIPEVPFDAAKPLAFLDKCQAEPYDLVVQLHGSGLNSNAFVQLMGAKETAGFYSPGLACPGADFAPYLAHGHESERLLGLARYLGWPDAGAELTFPITADDRHGYELLREEMDLKPQEYAVVHTGARDPARRWDAAKFAAVADALMRQGLRVLLTGVEGEREQVEAVTAQMAGGAEVVCGRTTLGSLACLLQESRVLVSNDTGVSHVAAALAVPSVTVFTHSDPERWAAKNTQRHRAFVEPTALTNPCCSGGSGHRCLADGCSFRPQRNDAPVDLEDVIEAALELSTGTASHAAAI